MTALNDFVGQLILELPHDVGSMTLRRMASDTSLPLLINQVEPWTVVEVRTASLMDPIELERIGQALYHLVDAEDKRLLIIDFAAVQYVSSQAIGIVMTLHKKLAALKHSELILCGVGEKLMQVIKITRLDRVLRLKPTQREAIKSRLMV